MKVYFWENKMAFEVSSVLFEIIQKEQGDIITYLFEIPEQ